MDLAFFPSNVDFNKIMPKLTIVNFPGEFFWAANYDPAFVSELMFRGFLPMASRGDLCEVLLLKLHTHRCLRMFDLVKKPHKNVIKKSKKFEFSVDTCFAKVAEGIVRCHGENWFHTRLVKTFTEMNANPDGYKQGRVQVHSFEIWKDGTLVAGECGYSCGKAYTSLSGFSECDGAGTLQMFVMVEHLKRLGFVLWDLGMSMLYKVEEFGAKATPRQEFLDLLAENRDVLLGVSVQVDPRINAKLVFNPESAAAGGEED